MGPLTEEQRERIRINRERALEIQRRKREERERQQQQQQQEGRGGEKGEREEEGGQGPSSSASIDEDSKKNSAVKRKADDERKTETLNSSSSSSSSSPQKKVQKTTATDSFLDDGLPIEPFEEGASEWVTKKEAMSTYCLSEGTLAVLQVEERDNPHNKLWKPMKLYRRTDVRQWAHKRWDGLQNLQAERERRQTKKLEKDMKDADDIFK
mmetsp:Transcript_1999/g.4594  ORF Transcript_1999/g.4594 Transcript_1999/m.4594 type:complete len:210 (-) Transcript_1999:773-1402(-)|eukprot:CAMPEP_0113514952 /NCGR_PEP_ID=MMETSP0014_2-20120614/40682_1 /TAXON_ID=2857 /ORGANISM="Nitzschia sp." /LENGTH=209 /DNA_ID=CAMNT_0000411481 /DNA_START=504 /DNA_END=1133 /DNA_ORIENTATION=- /assembly_acc=CAM_ASM_000159